MKFFRDMRIGLKLKLSFAVISLCIVVVGSVGVYNMRKININARNIYKLDLVAVKNISQIKSNIITINLKMLQLIREKDKLSINNLELSIEGLKDQDDRLLSEYDKTIRTSDGREMFSNFNKVLIDYREKRKTLLEYIDKEEYDNAILYYPKLDAVNNKIVGFLDKYVEDNVKSAEENYKKSANLYKYGFILIVLLIALIILFGTFISFTIASLMSKQINKLLIFAQQVVKGDFNHYIDIISNDEIGGLGKELNKAALARKEYELNLEKNYQELEASHEEITALEEELREKYNELSISEENLEYMAYHDYLTGLPNRQYMYNRFKNDFIDKNNSLMDGAILFIDLDNFKFINDTMGHGTGDDLIREIGERLKAMANKDAFLVRLGGDEFIFGIKNVSSLEGIEIFAKQILNCLRNPFVLNDISWQLTASIGISMFPSDGLTIDELLKKADIAMYQSKYGKKNRFTFFNDTMNKVILKRMKIEKYLRTALVNNEFLLYYQPQVEVSSGKITSFEALIRWNSPELGVVLPVDFIMIAEENQMIIEIGDWVMKTACQFIKELQDNQECDCYVSVNVSVLQFLQSDFIESVFKILEEIKLAPQFLELEITESVYIENYEDICKKLIELRESGVKIALDDFGKGYSSLSYLNELPIDTLKIDKVFIDSICENKERSLVESIIKMGHKMELDIIAEGVETNEQHEYLKNYKCNKIQGYLFSKPVPEQDAIKLLNENVRRIVMEQKTLQK